MPSGYISIYDLYIGRRFGRYVRSVGRCDSLLSESLGAYFNAPYVFLLDSGRSALLVALKMFGCAGREVLVNAYTTGIVHQTILAAGAKPKPFDLVPDTLEPNLDSVRRNWSDRTAAVIHTGLFGLPCNPGELSEEAKRRGVPLLEDACNSFGATWEGRLCGQFGSATILSFRIGKPLSSGGGALITSDPRTAQRIVDRIKDTPPASPARSFTQLLRSLADYAAFQPLLLRYAARPIRSLTKGTSLGRQLVRGGVVDTTTASSWTRIRRMGHWQAALALANLDEYPQRVILRRQVGRRIVARCRDLPLRFLINDSADWNGLFLPVLIPGDYVDQFVRWMRGCGFDATRFHASIPEQSFGEIALRDLSGTNFISQRLVCVPSTVCMNGQEERFHEAARLFFQRNKVAN